MQEHNDTNDTQTPEERIEAHRADLKALAESDLPVADIAERLLEAVDQ